MEQALTLAGFEVLCFGRAEPARAHLGFGAAAIVVCDVRLPGISGTAFLPEIHSVDADLPVIVVSEQAHIARAVQALRDGDYDFTERCFTYERLVAIVPHAA